MATAEQAVAKAASFIGQNGRKFTGHYGWADNTPWCALFQSYVKDQIDSSLWDSSAAVSGIVAQLDRIPDYEARPGDLVAFNWDGRTSLAPMMDHIGMVEWADIDRSLNGYFGTIEGNYGGTNLTSKVTRVTRNNQGNYFTAFFRPNYGSPKPPEGWSGPGQEIAGTDRYATAEAIANRKGWSGKLMAAAPDKWPDLVSGMWVAGRLNANILYDREDFYLSDGTGGVYLGSDNRYGTNRYTLDFWSKCKGFDPGDTCFVVPGDKFADAAACAWASYNRGIPVVLYEDHKNFYGLIGRFEHVIAIGDTVPKFDGETDRISGASRVEVSVGIAERYAETWGQPMIVTPDVPYDAIASAQWAGNDCVLYAGGATEDALRRHRGEITDLFFVGDENAVDFDFRRRAGKAAGLE